ncbi:hypothetical protein FQN54_001168 [Arachnomyces sp. PD_36]|nr:hypothetical protein FQN54_001168 [Arachnomyces sp. PD_36]
MDHDVENQFDKHHVVIVPAHPNKKPREWKILVLEPQIMGNLIQPGLTFADIHGRKLSFRNNAQPRARYFYFHYLCAMLYYSETLGKQGKSLNDLVTADMPGLSRAWGSEGSYMADNVIRDFIERLGDGIPSHLVRSMTENSFDGDFNPANEAINLRRDLEDLSIESENEEEYEVEEEEIEFEDEEEEDQGGKVCSPRQFSEEAATTET